MATYELTYGGIKLTAPTDEVRSLLASYRYNEQYPFVSPQPTVDYSQAFSSRLIALANFPTDPPMQVGRYFYPTHASRWSWYVGICSQSQLTAIQAQLDGATQMTPLTFNLRSDDMTHPENSGGISTPMLMLPPRPLGVTSSTLPRESMYLIVLVDERYNWQFRSAGVIGATALATWDSFLSALKIALGISITNAAFEAVYLSPEPDSNLYTNYESPAILLDALAWNTGRTFVRSFDGTYSLEPIGGNTADIAANRPAAPRYRAFGGDIYDPQETGTIQPWINAALPEKVTVTFPKYNNTTGSFVDPERAGFFTMDSYGEVFAIDCPLSSLGDPYDTYTGVVGSINVIADTCKALLTTDTSATPTNFAVLTALAQQLAKDYYSYQLRALDEAYNGIRDWAPDALNDLIFDYQPPKLIQTRVIRKPWDFQTWQMQHHVDATSPETTTIDIVTKVCPIVAT